MVKFKTWKDYYQFVKKYANASCVNCFYGGEQKDSEDDGMYKRQFCLKYCAMVEFAFQFVCAEWECEKNRKSLDMFDDDEKLFKCDVTVLENGKEWTIEEIDEVLKDYEKANE